MNAFIAVVIFATATAANMTATIATYGSINLIGFNQLLYGICRYNKINRRRRERRSSQAERRRVRSTQRFEIVTTAAAAAASLTILSCFNGTYGLSYCLTIQYHASYYCYCCALL